MIQYAFQNFNYHTKSFNTQSSQYYRSVICMIAKGFRNSYKINSSKLKKHKICCNKIMMLREICRDFKSSFALHRIK